MTALHETVPRFRRDRHNQTVPRHYYQLPGLVFDRPWALGPARFLPADTVRDVLSLALDAAPRSDSMRLQQEIVAERLTEWADDAVLEVTAADADRAARLAEEAMAVVRFFMRPHLQVNVEVHKVGLVGEIPGGLRDYIILWDDDQPIAAAGWQRVGGTVPFHFAHLTLEAWDANRSLEFLGHQLAVSPEQRSTGGRRALTALTMLDAGLRSLEPALRVLCAAIAVEVLFSRDDMGTAAQTTAIARRIAYLTCRGGCGRTAPHCPYTETHKGHKTLVKDLQTLAARGQGWQCSAFLDIAAPDESIPALRFPPLFSARNTIAHHGDATLTDHDLSHLIWVADEAIMAGLGWYASNPDCDMAALDANIGGQVPI